MNRQTILQLNNLNKTFYQTTAEDFNDSRQYYWEGWNKLLTTIIKDRFRTHSETTPNIAHTKQLKILDVGCGNARFAKFLSENIKESFNYTGIDNSKELLAIARNNKQLSTIKYKFKKADVIEKLLDNKFAEELTESYDVVVLFGVMHHIPNFDLRKKLIEILTAKLESNGILVFTAWQFAKEGRFKDRIVDPELIDLKNTEFEENDFILDWRRGEKAYRYCHFLNKKEIKKIIEQIPQVKVFDQFYADGKSGKLNLYTIIERT